MYERFSRTAFQALLKAREHAIRRGDPSITERALLIGVVAADPALAEALELEPSTPKDSTLNVTRDIWLSPGCEDIVTNAVGFVDDEELITAAHLLLSLSYDPVIARLRIGSNGATAESLRGRIRAFARIAARNEIRAAPVPGDPDFKSSRTLLDPRRRRR